MSVTRVLGLIVLLVMVSFLVAEVVQATPTRTGYRLTRGPLAGPCEVLTPPGGYAGQKIGLTPGGLAVVRAPRSVIEVLRGIAPPAPPAPMGAGVGTMGYDSDEDPVSPDWLLNLD